MGIFRFSNCKSRGFFCCRDIIPGEERFAGYYPANEDLFPGEGGFAGYYQPDEVRNTGEDFLTGISRP